MILHAHNASQDHDRVVIQSPDTDVAVLATHFFHSLACKQLWFRIGVMDKLRSIPIHRGSNIGLAGCGMGLKIEAGCAIKRKLDAGCGMKSSSRD